MDIFQQVLENNLAVLIHKIYINKAEPREQMEKKDLLSEQKLSGADLSTNNSYVLIRAVQPLPARDVSLLITSDYPQGWHHQNFYFSDQHPNQ